MSDKPYMSNQTGQRIKELKHLIDFMEKASHDDMSKQARKRFNEFLEETKKQLKEQEEILEKTGGVMI